MVMNWNVSGVFSLMRRNGSALVVFFCVCVDLVCYIAEGEKKGERKKKNVLFSQPNTKRGGRGRQGQKQLYLESERSEVNEQ